MNMFHPQAPNESIQEWPAGAVAGSGDAGGSPNPADRPAGVDAPAYNSRTTGR